MEISKDEFENIVIRILTEMPDKFKNRLENVDLVIEDKIRPGRSGRMTLGLYEGIPYNKRFGSRRIMPDKITIYKKSIELISSSEDEIEKNLKRVIYHEVGHYFGLQENKLRDLGY